MEKHSHSQAISSKRWYVQFSEGVGVKGCTGIDLTRVSFRNRQLSLDIKDRINISEREFLSVVARFRDIETKLRLDGKNIRIKRILVPYRIMQECGWCFPCLSSVEIKDPPVEVDISVSQIEKFLTRYADKELTDENVRTEYGKKAQHFEILMSISLLYYMTSYMKSWSPARIKRHGLRWFQSLSSLPVLGSIYVVKENGNQNYISSKVPKKQARSIRIEREEANISGYACAYDLFQEMIQANRHFPYREAAGFKLNDDRLRTLIGFGLAELTDDEGKIISRIGPETDLSRMSVSLERGHEKFRESNKKFRSWFLEYMLRFDPRLRRFVLGLIVLDRSNDELMTYEPMLASNNVLSRWFALNHFAVDNFVELCTDADLTNKYLAREGQFRVYFSCFADFLADLEAATAIHKSCEERMLEDLRRHGLHNKDKMERLVRHLDFLSLRRGKFSFSNAINATRKKGGVVINLAKDSSPEQAADINPWSVAVINWPKLDEFTLCRELEEKYADGEFHYIPELRFNVCKSLGVRLQDFDDVIVELFEKPSRKILDLGFRIAEQTLHHESHSPIMIGNLPHLLLVITKRRGQSAHR